MDWDDLRIFLHVARQPKLEEVAAHLHIDATTISRRIKRLEQELGLTLFERTRRGHALTPAGDRLAAQVETIESVSFDILSESSAEQTASGRIRLGAPEGLGSTVIAPALSGFRKAHPKIDIDLIALSGFVSVPKRQADMSVLLARPSAGRLKVRKLSDYALKLYGTAAYLKRCGRVTSVDQLQDHTLVGYVDDLIYSAQLRYFDELLPGLTPHLCSPSILAQLEMVRASAGLGILPVFMAAGYPELVNLLPEDIDVKRTFWLAIHQDVASLTRNKLMTEFLAERMATLP